MTFEDKIPVYIITGFLGAGKTTFLNHFIKSQPEYRIVVIENEVGKTNIDGAALIQSAVDIKELTAGCLCCDLNEKLYDLMYDLAKKRETYDMIVIETTGIADPASVAETIWMGGFMDRNFDLKATICIADAQNIQQSLEGTEEAVRQLAFCDMVLLNKCSDVPTSQIKEVKSLIEGIHPDIPIIEGSEGVFPIQVLSESIKSQKAHQDKIHNISSKLHQHKHRGIHTFTLTFDQPFEYRQLRHTLMLLLNINKHQIYRIKGIINVPDMENKIILQSVYKTFRMVEGSAWSLGEERKSSIVFIGKEVEKESMVRVFAQCLIK